MPGGVLLVFYLLVAALPLALARSLDWPLRPWHQELAGALGAVGFALLLMEFVLSGRFRGISGRIGIDRTMRFHQAMARVLTVLLLLHPFLYLGPFERQRPWDPTRAETIALHGPGLWTGIAAWLLLALVVVTAIRRDQLGFRYEAWRLSHGLGSALLAGLAAHHAIALGRYGGEPRLAGFWLALLSLALATLAWVYLVKPLLLRRTPYRVAAVRPVALRSWEVEIAPVGRSRADFEAGQFAWVKLDRGPWSLREHPFSYASAPAELPRLRFLIKEAGDFTDRIGSLRPGARAFLDGPHGHLVLPGREAGPLVFIAGGVGIAPALSILRQLRSEGDKRPLHLVYGNRVRDQICFAEELEAMQRTLDLRVDHVLAEPPAGWPGATGRLDRETLAPLLDVPGRADALYLLCGPPPMIEAVGRALDSLGVPRRRVVAERFRYD